MIGKAIHHILTNSGPITAIVGQRVIRGIAQQGTIHPYISFRIFDDSGIETKDIYHDQDEATIELLIYDQDWKQVDTLAAAVKSAMHGFSGSANGVQVVECRFDGGSDETVNISQSLYAISQDYRIVIKN